MPSATRVHSSDTQIFIDSVAIAGIQSKSVEINREYQDLRPLGSTSNKDKILTSNQTVGINLDYLVVHNGFDPFNTTNGLLNIYKQEIKIVDTTHQFIASGAYLQSCSLDISVGDNPRGSAFYEAEEISYNDGIFLTPLDQTEDQYASIFRPQEIIVSKSYFEDGIEGCDGGVCGFCIQSASINVSLNREAVNKVGEMIPRMRYPSLPINGEVSFEAVKTNMKEVDISSLILGKGDLTFDLKRKARNFSLQYKISDCSLISVTESLDLDGNAIINFSYQFPLNNSGLRVLVIGEDTGGCGGGGGDGPVCDLDNEWDNVDTWLDECDWPQP